MGAKSTLDASATERYAREDVEIAWIRTGWTSSAGGPARSPALAAGHGAPGAGGLARTALKTACSSILPLRPMANSVRGPIFSEIV